MKALPDKATLKSFLSSCVYLSRFVKGYATLTLPLYELEVELKTPLTSLRGTRSDGTPYWSEACEHSFKGIKQALCTAPCPIFPDFQKPMIMITDCHAKQPGGFPMQIDVSGVERPIAFHSRPLNKAELKYGIPDREALCTLAVLSRVCQEMEAPTVTAPMCLGH